MSDEGSASRTSTARAAKQTSSQEISARATSTPWRRPDGPPGTRGCAHRGSGGPRAADPSTPRSTTRCCSPTSPATSTGSYLGRDRKVHRRQGPRAQYGTFSGWDLPRPGPAAGAARARVTGSDFAQSLFNSPGRTAGVWDRWLHGATADPRHDRRPLGRPPSPASTPSAARNFDVRGRARLPGQGRPPCRTARGPLRHGLPGAMRGPAPRPRQVPASSATCRQDTCHCLGRRRRDPGGRGRRLRARPTGHDGSAGSTKRGPSPSARQLVAEQRSTRGRPPEGGYMRQPQVRRHLASPASPRLPATDSSRAAAPATPGWCSTTRRPRRRHGRQAAGRRAARHVLPQRRRHAGRHRRRRLRYDPTNEPGINVPYLYNTLARPGRPRRRSARDDAAVVQDTAPAACPATTTSAPCPSWYVFAALGMYPQMPSRAEMLLSSPMFPKT